MALSLAQAELSRRSLDVIGDWMLSQRWYRNKGTVPQLSEVGQWSHPSPWPDVMIRTHLILDSTPGNTVLYQVPLTHRETPLDDASAIVGQAEDIWLHDGPRDPLYRAALLSAIQNGATLEGRAASAEGRPSGMQDLGETRSKVLVGEQSNTSIIYASSAGSPVICKLFRALHDGENPDVVLQTALAEAQCTSVPASVGSLYGRWADSSIPGGWASGQVAFAQEFLDGAEDGWRLLLDEGANGREATAAAHALGAATAGVHAQLAQLFPTRAVTPAEASTIVDGMMARLNAALEDAAELAELRPAIVQLLNAARTASWPDSQRIHGDLHLGQSLNTPDRGWVLVDFEGEPMRSMAERVMPDSPLRDIAGMLRSFDYAGGALDAASTPAPAGWVARARGAFLEGYGADLSRYELLLKAFEIDKALYEVVYEARNRPTWLAIPVTAIRRLVG